MRVVEENLSDTIAAIATPLGTGALSVIRISGSGALRVAEQCAGRAQWQPRMATLAFVCASDGSHIDHALWTWFPAPASFTGEDVVEVSCHGGVLVTQRVLDRLTDCGARLAEPGEFSQRAFLNGKMDLTQAEAVMDIISAGSDLALRAAQNQLKGEIGHRVSKQAEALIALTARIEAYIDFPDEEISVGTAEGMAGEIDAISCELDSLVATADCGRLLREGIRTVIAGPPNVGKSSLLNALLGYERAIVSGVAGTTRDTIEERVLMGGLCLRLTDTAGLHDSNDPVECAGMERSRRAVEEADLLIEVADASCAPSDFEVAGNVPLHILVLNKSDLGIHPAWKASGRSFVAYSCLQAIGKKELEQAIVSRVMHSNAISASDHIVAVNARHRCALQDTLTALQAARASLLRGDSPELTAFELREALEYLGAVTGRIDTEDILDSVFSQFCLGK